MSTDPVTITDIHRKRLGFIEDHGRIYLETGGVEGHIVDLRRDARIRPHRVTTCLLLQTVGRKSGIRRSVPLNYGLYGGELVVIASKGGADVHPAWYLNLRESDEARVQVATQAFRGTWREPEEPERSAIWSFMEAAYPPYQIYRQTTSRTIPVVMIKPDEEIPVFTE